MSDPLISVYVGVVGAGKDFCVKKLVQAGTHDPVDFKDGLISLVSDIVGYDIKESYDHFKTHVIGVRPASNPLSQGFQDSEWKDLIHRFPELMTGRKMLQRLGTEGMRKRDSEYWVKTFVETARKSLKAGRKIANADCRFFNEIAAVKRLAYEFGGNASFVFCDYRSSRYNPLLKHPSETLAQTLLGMGLKDGEEIRTQHFEWAQDLLRQGKGDIG